MELRGAAPGLIDDPLTLEVGGAPPRTKLTWRARIRDDDGFVWRAVGAEATDMTWSPAKASAGDVAALRSLRPVTLDVRVEDPDGASASRTLTRTVLTAGAKVRRWKAGTLYLPAEPATVAVLAPADAAVAAALLASRGVLVCAGDGAAILDALPSPPDQVHQLDALPVPPGVPARAPADVAAWDALLADLGATPRRA